MTETYALLASGILAALTIFQVSLIFGAPIGRFAWGGEHTVLPRRLRIASIFSIILYCIFAVFILSKAPVFQTITSSSIVTAGMWLFTGYFFLGVLVNAISRSKYERIVMTPTALVLAILFLLVTLG